MTNLKVNGKMKIYDGHIHIMDGDEKKEVFPEKVRKAGIHGGILLSLPPASFPALAEAKDASERLENLFDWCSCDKNFFPFFWIDPLEADAHKQVLQAVSMGVKGFKVICDRYYPGDKEPMSVFHAVAEAGKPILFHSGILWDGKASSMYNRPVCFEPLLEIRKLKFALAHISWPWCEEMIAVYGKFQNAFRRRPDLSCELFIDTTPGTPEICRKEVLKKLFKTGYNIEKNVFFGSDAYTTDYPHKFVRKWINKDLSICRSSALSKKTIDGIFSKNLLRFIEEP